MVYTHTHGAGLLSATPMTNSCELASAVTRSMRSLQRPSLARRIASPLGAWAVAPRYNDCTLGASGASIKPLSFRSPEAPVMPSYESG